MLNTSVVSLPSSQSESQRQRARKRESQRERERARARKATSEDMAGVKKCGESTRDWAYAHRAQQCTRSRIRAYAHRHIYGGSTAQGTHTHTHTHTDLELSMDPRKHHRERERERERERPRVEHGPEEGPQHGGVAKVVVGEAAEDERRRRAQPLFGTQCAIHVCHQCVA